MLTSWPKLSLVKLSKCVTEHILELGAAEDESGNSIAILGRNNICRLLQIPDSSSAASN